jgi:rubrerythrin
MRRPRYLDFDCPSCGCAQERFVETNDDGTPIEPQRCDAAITSAQIPPEKLAIYNIESETFVCNGVLVPREVAGVGCMQTINKHNSDYNERERERLEKRSDAHFRKHGRDEAIERERAVLKKNGMEGAGGVW